MTTFRSRLEEELAIIPAGWWTVAIVGFISIEVLFHVLIPRWSHRPHELPGLPWWGILAFAGAVLCAAMIALTGYIYADAKRRGMQAVLWVILIVLIPKPIGYIAYFLLRKPLLGTCPRCQERVSSEFHYCPKCNFALWPVCAHCGRPISKEFVFCPYCGGSVGAIAAAHPGPAPS